MHTTNYQNTFIQIAEDCPAQTGEAPPQKGTEKSVAMLQLDMLIDKPYVYTSDEVLFGVFALRSGFSQAEMEQEREKFFSKGQPCFRSSPLTKRYGWGVHSDAEGKIAIYPAGSEAYEGMAQNPELKQVKAMRSKRG